MTSQQVGDILVFIAVPSATLFPILYGLTAPFYRSMTGWAIVTAKVGLAMLVDASAAFRLFGPYYPYRAQVLLVAFGVIVVGSWLYLIAYVRIQYLKRYKRGHP